MADAQYKTLLSKYNIAVARCRDLEEQNNVNRRHWKAEEEHFKKVEDLARKLCEMILAKDPAEMVLGENRSWYATPVDELILRAQKSYKTYNQKTTRILNDIQDKAEKRRAKIEGLEDQIQQYLAGNGFIAPIGTADSQTGTDEDESKQQINAPGQIGKVDVVIEDEEDAPDAEDIHAISELMGINEQAKLTANAVPVSDAAQKVRMMERERENAMMAHMIDLIELEKRFNDAMWSVLSYIGGEGIAKYPELERRMVGEEPETAKSKVRTATQELYKMKILDQESLNLPLTPRILVYKLTDIGIRLYRKHFEKMPVESEIDRVRKEHDNLEHGYGIMDLERVLSECSRYREVRIFNRDRAVNISGNRKYVPDIIAFPAKGSYTEYIEYERGYHTQPDFNAKCNKMCKVTRFLNFVAPNRQILIKKLCPQVEAWIQERGIEGIRNIRIRLSTPVELRAASSTDAWLIVYDLSKGAKPVKDGTRKEAGTL